MLSVLRRRSKSFEEELREYLTGFNIVEKFNHVLKTYFPEVPPNVIEFHPVPMLVHSNGITAYFIYYYNNRVEIYANVLEYAALYSIGEEAGNTALATAITSAVLLTGLRDLIECEVLNGKCPEDLKLLYEVPAEKQDGVAADLLTLARSPDLNFPYCGGDLGIAYGDPKIYCAAREALLYAKENGIILNNRTAWELLWRACVKYRDPPLGQ